MPVNTIRRWRNRGVSRGFSETVRPSATCARCGGEPHDNASPPRDAYAYVLGVYLGDGYLARNGNSWMLRIVLDDAYPAIATECCDVIEDLRGGSRPTPDTILTGTMRAHLLSLATMDLPVPATRSRTQTRARHRA